VAAGEDVAGTLLEACALAKRFEARFEASGAEALALEPPALLPTERPGEWLRRNGVTAPRVITTALAVGATLAWNWWVIANASPHVPFLVLVAELACPTAAFTLVILGVVAGRRPKGRKDR